MIYTPEHASLAAWEKIVHVASSVNLPPDLFLVKMEIADQAEIYSVPQKIMIKGWDGFPFAQGNH